MAGRLAGKVALVTGAGSVGPGWGNGRAAAVLFAREGAKVAVVDLDPAAAGETARLIGEEKGEAFVLEADVTDLASVTAMAADALKQFGRIDVLLNNVGGSITGGPVEMSVEDFRGQLDLNLTSVFVTCKVLLPDDGQAGLGRGRECRLDRRPAPPRPRPRRLSASKAGLVQFTRQIAVRYAPHNIRCNTVIPGMIDTPLLEHRVSRQKGRADLATLRNEAKVRVPLGRRGDAWDVAYAALFLASDEAKYVTGTEILVDGGLMARSA